MLSQLNCFYGIVYIFYKVIVLLHLSCYADSDWGGDPDDKWSTSVIAIFLGNSLISWLAKKQSVVALSLQSR